MVNRYSLHLVPEDGATTVERTDQEFILGYTFRILSSSLLSMPRNSYVTADDIKTAMREYDIHFDVSFKTLTKVEALRQEAETSYTAAEAVALLDNGSIRL